MSNVGMLDICIEESYYLLLLPSPGARYPDPGKSRDNGSRSLLINVEEFTRGRANKHPGRRWIV